MLILAVVDKGAAAPEVMVMAHVVVLGAGIGGTSLAWELAGSLGDGHSITVIGDGPRFSFIPSNPWVAVGWRSADDVEVDLEAVMKRRGIEFVKIGRASCRERGETEGVGGGGREEERGAGVRGARTRTG